MKALALAFVTAPREQLKSRHSRRGAARVAQPRAGGGEGRLGPQRSSVPVAANGPGPASTGNGGASRCSTPELFMWNQSAPTAGQPVLHDALPSGIAAIEDQPVAITPLARM